MSARYTLVPQFTERSSPLSLKVIFEQVRRGGNANLQECLDDEFSVNTHLFGLPDFEMAMQARDGGVSEDRSGKPHSDALSSVVRVHNPLLQSSFSDSRLIASSPSFSSAARAGHQLGNAGVWRKFPETKSRLSSKVCTDPSSRTMKDFVFSRRGCCFLGF